MIPLNRALCALALSALALGCTCGEKEPAPEAPPLVKKPVEAKRLDPLPEAPVIQVDPEALPGANGELAVVVARPQGEATGRIRPTITFSKPVMALGTVENEKGAPPVAEIAPKLEGEWRWLGSASVEFVAKGLVPFSTTFKITVPAGLVALDGAKLTAPYSFEFTTPRPSLQVASPQDGFRWATPDQLFLFTFNQPVKDLLGNLTVTAAGKPVAMTLVREVDVAEELRAAEKDRRFARQDFEERGFKNRQTRYELKPAQPLPPGAALAFTFAAALPGKEGPLTMGKQRAFSFHSYGPMGFLRAQSCTYRDNDSRCSWGPLVLMATNKIDLATLKTRLTVEPKVELDWDSAETNVPESWSTLKDPYATITGKFRPGTTYTVKVAPGVEDEFKQASKSAFNGTFRFDDLPPAFTMGASLALLEANGKGALPLESANVTRAETEIWPMSPEELAPLLDDDRPYDQRATTPPRPPTQVTVDLTSPRNFNRITPLELRQALPPGKKTGLFLVRGYSPDVKSGPNGPDRQRVIAQLTDLAVHTKLGPKSGVAWVTSLATGAPVGGATIALYNRRGEKKWEGVADAEGLAKIPGLPSLLPEENFAEWRTPFALVSAKKDDDTGITLSWWDDGVSASAFELPTDWDGTAPKSLGLVFADRGIYRPGDEVFFKGLARFRRLGEIARPPAGAKVVITVTSSRSEKISEQTLAMSDFGTFAGKLTLTKEAPLGTYSIAAVAQSGAGESLTYGGSFRVEEYRPPQFQVDVSLPAKDVTAGEPLTATVLSRYLFGGAMSGARVHWSVSRTSSSFAPPGNEPFTFGPNSWWWDDNQPSPSSDVFAGGDGESDAQGALSLPLGKADAPGEKTWDYTVEAEVTDVNRLRLSNRASLTVHPAAAYAGVRVASAGFAEVNKPVKLELVAASPDGKRVAGAKISLEVRRREWKSIKKKGVGGRWFYTSEPVETKVSSCEVTTETNPSSCEVKPELPGLYVLEAKLTDAAGRKQTTRSSFYAVGPGWVSWQRNDTDRIELVADKLVYDVGDTAKILVKSPYPECEALLTLEREGVQFTRHIKLTGAASTLEIPLDESMVPNVFAGLLIVRGRVPTDKGIETGEDPGRPAVRVGFTELKVEKKSKRLTVKIAPDAEQKRPREKVTVSINVADFQGKGKKAEVTAWAVDEGVLRLTDYQVPDPVEAIHPRRGLSVRLGEPLMHLVLEKLFGDKGATTGGSGGLDSSGAGFRNRFKTTVLFAPTVLTDEQGNAKVEFELPDNLTTFRVMAVAASAEDHFGSGQSKVVVSKPLLALPALPRIARVGDRFEAGVVIHSNGAKAADVKVTASAEGVGISGASEKTISITDGRPHEVRFTFVPDGAGMATLRFKIEGGGESDGLEQKLPILLPVSMEAVATYGDTTDKRTEGIVPPGGVRPGVGGLETTLSSTALGNFDEGMRQLVDYPYGCLEQMSSRLVPFIALRELYGKFGVAAKVPGAQDLEAEKVRAQQFMTSWIGEPTLKLYDTSDPDEVVRRTVKSIELLQNPDGGFRYWPSSSCSDQYASSYAVLALSRAKDVGYPVSAAVVASGQKFLADTVAAGKCVNCGWGCHPPGNETRIFALYALARSKAPKASYYADLFRGRATLPLFAKAMLADAMYVGGGDRAQAKTLMTEIMNFAKESASEVHFEETDANTYASLWSSDTRTTSIVLGTLTDISPDHPFVSKIARHLVQARKADGRFRNTQEAAFSLLALDEVVRTKEKETPDFTAKLMLGEKMVAEVPFRGRDLGVKRFSGGINELGPLTGKLPLVFSKDGPGVLYYGALLRYAPKELPTTPLDRGIVVQRWFEPYTGGGQSKTFSAGELVRVRVRVATHMERHFVAVDVALPSGLEPVDTSLATTAKLPKAPGEEGSGEGYENESAEEGYGEGAAPGEFSAFASSFYSPFNHVEHRDDRVVLFSDSLPPGVHNFSFVARATTPGDFVLKPAQAEEMYSPEVFGRSDGGRFTITLPAPVAER